MSEILKCTEFLLQAKVITEKFDKLFKKQGLHFNIFQILDRKTSEVKGHSAFLSELLNPGGTHGQGNLFLNLFFDHIINLNNERGLSFSFQESLKQDKDWTVRTERGAGKWGRIDITIEAKDSIIVIENKIYAEDRKSQLSDYYEYAKGKKKEIILIYLSLVNESKPDDKSLLRRDGQAKLNENKVFHLTYDSFVDGWIQECIKASATLPHIRETLIQYQNILLQLTGCGENEDMTNEIVDLIIKDNNIRAACEIKEALTQAKIKIQLDFWAKLKKKLEEKKEWDPKDFHDFKMYDEYSVEEFYKNKNGGYGISIKVGELNKQLEIIYKIEIYDNIYFVFYLKHQSEGYYYDKKDDKYESLREITAKMDKEYKNGTGVAWRYPFTVKKLYFQNSDEAYEDFVNLKELEKYTDELSDEFISDAKDFKAIYKSEFEKCS